MNSIKSTEEILAANVRWSFVKEDRNGTRYFADSTCQRCGGRGIIHCYQYIDGGICFECGGSGLTHKPSIIKIYTPEHEAKLDADRAKRAEARLAAKVKDFREHLPEKYQAIGFGVEDGEIVAYRVVGDTYPIKDTLKELGCKFNGCLGWYCAHDLDGYETQRILANQVTVVDEAGAKIEWIAVEEAKKLWVEVSRAAEESTSEWQGEIGDRIDVQLHIDRAFEGKGYGYNSVSYMYLMSDEDGNKYKWSTSCYYETGFDVHFKATVKEHAEYKGIKQTVLTRCTKVKE